MAQVLRQSTAVDVLIGPFVDSTDGYTAETGVSPAVKLSKNGQALAAKNDATTPVHDADGYYNCELDATDTSTVGTLILSVVGSATSLPVRHEFQVVEEAVYDAMYASSAAGPLQSTTAGRTLDVTAAGTAGIDWSNIENPTTVVDLSGTDIQLCDTVTTLTGHTPQTGDSFARLGAPAGASVSADIAVIDGNVDSILVDTGTTLDTKLNDIQGATFSSATDSLEAIRDRGDTAWTTGAGGTPPQLLQSTTIATLASQTSFTLTAGSTDDNAYNEATIIVTDQSTSTQKAVGKVSDYTGSSKTITLITDPGIFTMAVGDTVDIIATDGTDGATLSSTTQIAVADALLDRDMSAVSDTNTRSPLNALRFLRNKWSIAGTTLTVTEEDDSTSAWTSTLSTDATADPVTGSDPA